MPAQLRCRAINREPETVGLDRLSGRWDMAHFRVSGPGADISLSFSPAVCGKVDSAIYRDLNTSRTGIKCEARMIPPEFFLHIK